MKNPTFYRINEKEMQYAYAPSAAFLFVVFLLLYEITTYIANDMIMPGMIEVVRAFHAPESMVSTSLTAYILGGASLQILLGPLSDRFGRRPVMLAGSLFFLICTLFIAFSQTIESFMIARFFQGMGLCFISVIGYAALQEIFSELQAVRLVSMMASISILAPLAGPLLGSVVMIAFHWRIIFVIIAVLAFIALVGLWFFMPETVGVKKNDDTFVSHTALDVKTVTKNYVALFRNKAFMLGAIAIGIANIPIIAWIGTSPLMLMEAANLSVIQYGLLQIPIFLCLILGNTIMRRCSYYMSLRKMTLYGSLMMIINIVLLIPMTIFLQQNYIALVIGLSLYGIGLGFIIAPFERLTLFATAVPKGTASAVLSLSLMLMISLGNQIAGWLYFNHNNLYFSLFCAGCGIIYAILFAGFLKFKN